MIEIEPGSSCRNFFLNSMGIPFNSIVIKNLINTQ